MKWLSIVLLGAVGCSGNPHGCSSTVKHPSTTWNSYQVPPYGVDIGAVKGPDYVKVVDDVPGTSVGIYAACFSPSSDEHIFSARNIPRLANEGSTAGTTIFWFQHGAGSGNVVWAFEIAAANTGAVFGDSTIISQTFAAAGTTLEVVKSEFTALPFAGTDKDTATMARFFRDADAGADTLGVDACIAAVRIDFTSDKTAEGER